MGRPERRGGAHSGARSTNSARVRLLAARRGDGAVQRRAPQLGRGEGERESGGPADPQTQFEPRAAPPRAGSLETIVPPPAPSASSELGGSESELERGARTWVRRPRILVGGGAWGARLSPPRRRRRTRAGRGAGGVGGSAAGTSALSRRATTLSDAELDARTQSNETALYATRAARAAQAVQGAEQHCTAAAQPAPPHILDPNKHDGLDGLPLAREPPLALAHVLRGAQLQRRVVEPPSQGGLRRAPLLGARAREADARPRARLRGAARVPARGAPARARGERPRRARGRPKAGRGQPVLRAAGALARAAPRQGAGPVGARTPRRDWGRRHALPRLHLRQVRAPRPARRALRPAPHN